MTYICQLNLFGILYGNIVWDIWKMVSICMKPPIGFPMASQTCTVMRGPVIEVLTYSFDAEGGHELISKFPAKLTQLGDG